VRVIRLGFSVKRAKAYVIAPGMEFVLLMARVLAFTAILAKSAKNSAIVPLDKDPAEREFRESQPTARARRTQSAAVILDGGERHVKMNARGVTRRLVTEMGYAI